MERDVVHISEAAERLGVTPQYLRMLEQAGKVPPVARDRNGRVYSEFDLALLRSMGVGSRPQHLKSAVAVLETAR